MKSQNNAQKKMWLYQSLDECYTNILLVNWRRNIILIICQTVRLDFTLLKHWHRSKFEGWGGIFNTPQKNQREKKCVLNIYYIFKIHLQVCRYTTQSPWKRLSLKISSFTLLCSYCWLFCWSYSNTWQCTNWNIVALLLHLNYENNLCFFPPKILLLAIFFSLMNNCNFIYWVSQCLQVGVSVTFRHIYVSVSSSVLCTWDASCSLALPTPGVGGPPQVTQSTSYLTM